MCSMTSFIDPPPPQQWVPFVPLAEQDGEDQLNGDDDVSRALHSSSVVELFVSLTECRKFMNRIKRYGAPYAPPHTHHRTRTTAHLLTV